MIGALEPKDSVLHFDGKDSVVHFYGEPPGTLCPPTPQAVASSKPRLFAGALLCRRSGEQEFRLHHTPAAKD
jgi:hypothetical protein